MKKLFYWSVPMKSFSAMVFAGFIILYMIVGTGYAFITGEAFEYAIPFLFAVQAAVLSIIIAVLWTVIVSDLVAKKMRYFKRIIIFSLILLPVFGASFLIFHVASAEWTPLWFIIGGLIIIGLIIISLLFEAYFKMIGRQYTNVLKDYKAKIK